MADPEPNPQAPPEETKIACCNYVSRWIGCFDLVGNGEMNLREGVLKNRTCTDVPWVIACFLFTVVCISVIWVPAISNGEWQRFLGATDFDLNTCGQGDFEDFRFGAWPDLTEPKVQICIAECSETQSAVFSPVLYGETGYETEENGFWCTPLLDSAMYDYWMDTFKENALVRYVQDMYNNYMIPVYAIPLTFLFLIVFFVFVRFCLKMVLRCCFVGIFGATAFLSYTMMSPGKDSDPQSYWGGVIILIIGVMFFYIVMCCWNQLMTVVEVLEDSSRALMKMPQLILVPLMTLPITVGIVVAWYCITLLVLSSGEPSEDAITSDYTQDAITYYYNNNSNYTYPAAPNNSTGLWENTMYKEYELNYGAINTDFIFHIFWMLWGIMFVEYLNFVTIAGCVADWYLDTELVDNPNANVEYEKHGCCGVNCWRMFQSFYRCIRYHFGTIAFASALIAAIQTIEAVLMYTKQQMGDTDNPFAKMVLNIVMGVIKCLECIINRCNKNTLVVTAVMGTPFCGGCAKSMALFWSNMGVMTMGTGMIAVMCYLSNSVIAMFAAAGGLWLGTGGVLDGEDMNSMLAPAIAAFLVSWVITKVVIGVWDAIASTILVCRCMLEYYYPDDFGKVGDAKRAPKEEVEMNECENQA